MFYKPINILWFDLLWTLNSIKVEKYEMKKRIARAGYWKEKKEFEKKELFLKNLIWNLDGKQSKIIGVLKGLFTVKNTKN